MAPHRGPQWPRCPSPCPTSAPWRPSGVFRGAVTHFDVDARALGSAGGAAVSARIRSPSGGCSEADVEDRGDGTYGLQYSPYEEGGRRNMGVTSW